MTEQSESDQPSAEVIRDLWEAELELESPATTQTSEETRLATLMRETPIPIISSPPERTWIWSDLHLADRSVLAAWNRPFRNIDEMNRHLLREWSRRVHADDTIICLGDVAHPDAWRDRRLVLDVRNCPGEQVLVLGNHDHDTEGLHDAGFETMCVAALCATDPPLALSHLPLRRVPPTGSQRPRAHPQGQSAEPTPLQRVRGAHRLRPSGTDLGARTGEGPANERRGW